MDIFLFIAVDRRSQPAVVRARQTKIITLSQQSFIFTFFF